MTLKRVIIIDSLYAHISCVDYFNVYGWSPSVCRLCHNSLRKITIQIIHIMNNDDKKPNCVVSTHSLIHLYYEREYIGAESMATTIIDTHVRGVPSIGFKITFICSINSSFSHGILRMVDGMNVNLDCYTEGSKFGFGKNPSYI